MIVQASDNTHFLVLRRLCTENEFIAAASARPSTPAADLAGRMYACIFLGVTDVVRQYEMYYKTEYLSIWSFLYWHYIADEDDLRTLQKAFRPSYLLLYGHSEGGGDYSMSQFIMSEEGFPVVETIFKKLRTRRQI